MKPKTKTKGEYPKKGTAIVGPTYLSTFQFESGSEVKGILIFEGHPLYSKAKKLLAK